MFTSETISSDEELGDGEYIVIRAESSREDMGGPGQCSIDSFRVHAKVLSIHGEYDPYGTEFWFNQSGTYYPNVEDIKKTRTMRMYFK